MSVAETALQFDCAGARLSGILHGCESPRTTGVLVVVGGPQYRAGSHRQFVQLARSLALRGYPVLRFDVRGMGDSEGEPRAFTELDDDIQAGLQAFAAAQPALERFVLWGLCDGASAALLHVLRTSDPRVTGLCLLNPWLRSSTTLARAQVKHYYVRRLLQGDFWRKLLRGGVAWSALSGLASNVGTAIGSSRPATSAEDFREVMARAWRQYSGPILLVLSGNDLTAKEFLEALPLEPAWAGALARRGLTRVDIAAADHTFSGTAERLRLESAVGDWLDAHFAAR